MKKRICFIFILFLVFATKVLASSPADYQQVLSNNVVKEGKTVTITEKVINGNVIGYMASNLSYEFDDSVFEFVSFKSEYGFIYNEKTKEITHSDYEMGIALSYEKLKINPNIWSITLRYKSTNFNEIRIGNLNYKNENGYLTIKPLSNESEILFQPAMIEEKLSSEVIENGKNITISENVISGNLIGYYLSSDGTHPYSRINYEFDDEVFEFVSFESKYGFVYNKETKKITNNKYETEQGAIVLPIDVLNTDSTLWTITLRYKTNNFSDSKIWYTYYKNENGKLITYDYDKDEETNNDNTLDTNSTKTTETVAETKEVNNELYVFTIFGVLLIVIIILIICIVKLLKNKK